MQQGRWDWNNRRDTTIDTQVREKRSYSPIDNYRIAWSFVSVSARLLVAASRAHHFVRQQNSTHFRVLVLTFVDDCLEEGRMWAEESLSLVRLLPVSSQSRSAARKYLALASRLKEAKFSFELWFSSTPSSLSSEARKILCIFYYLRWKQSN